MDHSQAVSLKATEQYLLGELSGNVREEFEEHFMSCAECAREVRSGAAFIESAREVLRSEAPARARAVPSSAGGAGWLAGFFRPAIVAPVFAILVAIVVYQGLKIPRLESSLSTAEAPRALTSFSLINANSRGGGAGTFIARAGQPFALYVDIPPQPAFPAYEIEVRGENGEAELAISVSAEEAKNTVQVLVPGARLKAGSYQLVVLGSSGANGGSGAEVTRYPFALEYK